MELDDLLVMVSGKVQPAQGYKPGEAAAADVDVDVDVDVDAHAHGTSGRKSSNTKKRRRLEAGIDGNDIYSSAVEQDRYTSSAACFDCTLRENSRAAVIASAG